MSGSSAFTCKCRILVMVWSQNIASIHRGSLSVNHGSVKISSQGHSTSRNQSPSVSWIGWLFLMLRVSLSASDGLSCFWCMVGFSSFFEFVVAERFPRPFITKVKEKLVPAIPVIWHERNLPKTELENYTTTLDFHVELAVLYLIPITPMKSLSRLANTMFEYLEWRFMIGESVLVYQNDEW